MQVGEDPAKGEKVALKRIEKLECQLSREFEVLKELSGARHCVELRDCFFSRDRSGRIFQNLIFEFLEFDLRQVISHCKANHTFLDERAVKLIGFQILLGLREVHRKGVVHRDLKPENILVGERGVVKLGDFGSAKFLSGRARSDPHKGSRFYRAPELWFGVAEYGFAVDAWSAGCVLAELALLRPVFEGRSDVDQLAEIVRVWGGMRLEQLEYFAKLSGLNGSALRPLAHFGRNEPELVRLFGERGARGHFLGLLDGLFEYNPSERLTVEQALRHPFFFGVSAMYRKMMDY